MDCAYNCKKTKQRLTLNIQIFMSIRQNQYNISNFKSQYTNIKKKSHYYKFPKKLICQFPFQTDVYKRNYLYDTKKNHISPISSAQKKRYCKQILHTVAFFRYNFSFVATNDYFVK